MRKLFVILSISFLSLSASATEIDDVKQVVENYSNYDNNFNADGLSNITDESFHFMMHASGDTETITTIPKEAFLAGIAAKKFGGNNKTLKIETVTIQGNIANVYFTQKGKQAGFHHFMNLIKLNGEWKAAATAAHMEMYE